ncbi:hypothetical protein DBR47_24090 [Paucibacter sp. KBW04]|uniref:hypothetical protein n=1 Tax=Paucibacter sp. KBW04 TaxID=2153361 RepID=UPI000F57A055|nr:hypothetical protein [Paucibacter sp. KBW04]RQO53501.1 hypothetical protein DBR47_24090 [Paucibacter sp. KBW04]
MKLWRGQEESLFVKFTLTANERAAALVSLGGMALLMAWLDWTQPKSPPFTGKWAWLQSWAFESMGPHGPAFLHLLLGGAFLLGAALTWWRR